MTESLLLKITDVEIRLAKEGSPESTLATGRVTYNDGLHIRVRVMKSTKNGPFGKMPNFRIGDGDAARWFDYAYFGGPNARKLREEFNTAVVASYEAKAGILGQAVEVVTDQAPDATEVEDTPFPAEEDVAE